MVFREFACAEYVLINKSKSIKGKGKVTQSKIDLKTLKVSEVWRNIPYIFLNKLFIRSCEQLENNQMIRLPHSKYMVSLEIQFSFTKC